MRLLKAPAALVVVGALLILPSVYTWYNVWAFWDPYGNTGNLKVAFVNEDKGARLEDSGQINIGTRIAESLEHNDKLDFIFLDRETALDELKSGKLHAVYVVPSGFSAAIVSPLSGTPQAPKLEYLANEKLGPVGAKVTDQAASTLDRNINSMIVTTVMQVAVREIDEAIENGRADVSRSRSVASERVAQARGAIDEVRTALSDIVAASEKAKEKSAAASAALEDASTLVASSTRLLEDLSSQMAAVRDSFAGLPGSSGSTLSRALAKTTDMTGKANAAASALAASAGEAKTKVDVAAAQIQPVIDSANGLAEDLRAAAADLPESLGDVKARLEQAAADMSARTARLQETLDTATGLSGRLAEASARAERAAGAMNDTARSTSEALQGFSGELYGETAPQALATLSQLSADSSALSADIAGLDALIGQAKLGLGQVEDLLGDGSSAAKATDGVVAGLQESLDRVVADVSALGVSTRVSELVEDGKLSESRIASFMGSPTKIETVEFYRPNSYGTSMAPFFMNLTCWIGAFMLIVLFRIEVDEDGVGPLTRRERYLARFILLALLGVAEAIICATGTLILGVEAANIPALYLAAVCASLTYMAIIFALSSALRHVGEGLCMMLVFAQIPGGSGLYPVEMTQPFFRAIYPFLPFNYGIRAVREAIGGLYGTDLWKNLAVLGLFFAVFTFFGLRAGRRTGGVVEMATRQLQAGGLFHSEDAVAPASGRALAAEPGHGLAPVLETLVISPENRELLRARYEVFRRRYPRFLRASLVLGIAVPLALALMGVLNAAEKVTLLTLFLVWAIGLLGFLVWVESVRDGFERRLSLGEEGSASAPAGPEEAGAEDDADSPLAPEASEAEQHARKECADA